MARCQNPPKHFYIWNFKTKKNCLAEKVKKFVVECMLEKFHVNSVEDEQDIVGKVDALAEEVKMFVVERILCLLDDFDWEKQDEVKKVDDYDVIAAELKPFLLEALSKLEAKDEIETMDMNVKDVFIEELERFLLELIWGELDPHYISEVINSNRKCSSEVEVGTVDVIAECAKGFLVGLITSQMHYKDVQVPVDIAVNLQLSGSCCLSSYHSSIRRFSRCTDETHGSIFIHALSGDVEDIFQVLLKMKIDSFNLKPVSEKYHRAVEDFLSSNPHLRRLSVDEHYLKKNQDLVRNVIKSSRSLSTLAFTLGEDEDGSDSDEEANTQPDQGLREYMLHIHESESLETLDLTGVENLTSVVIDGLVKGFARSPKIKTLDMSNYYMPYVNCMSMIRYHYSLISDISKLVEVLKNTDTLEEWKLGGRPLENSHILQCANLLEGNKSLKKLDISNYYYDESGDDDENVETDILLPMLEALGGNQTLQSLEVSNYNLSDSFASLKVLETVLVENRSLKSLVLRNSCMTDEGVTILSRSLPKMKGIEKLDLRHHGCTSKGAQSFAEGMKDSYNIVSVEFGLRDEKVSANFLGTLQPVRVGGRMGFKKEYHRIMYYIRMNRKGRRCMGSKTPIQPSLWALMLAKAQQKEKEPLPYFDDKDVRGKDWFAGDHDTSIDAVFYLLRDVLRLPEARD